MKISGIDLFANLTSVSLSDFSDQFSQFRKSAVRLEMLPAYGVSFEREAYAMFQNGGKMPADYNSDWANTLIAAQKREASFSRFRIVPRKPSEYLKFEISWPYVVNQKAGDRITFAFEDEFRERLPEGTPILDFWLFDDSSIYPMFYDLRGEFLGASKSENTRIINWGHDLLDAARSCSKLNDMEWALNEYAPNNNRSG